MSRAKLLAAAALAAVVVAAAWLLATHRGGGAASPSQATGNATGTAPGVLHAGSLGDCSGDAVAIVYAKGQESLADKMAELLSQQLRGHVPNGTKFCTVPAAAAGMEKARVLPLILVRAENVSTRLGQLLLNTTIADGFRPVRYDVDAVFAVRVALQFNLPKPVYGVEAKALVLEPRSSVAALDPETLEKQEQLLSLTEAVFAAKIATIEKASSNISGYNWDTRPGLVLESSVNLSEGNPAVISLGNGYYAAREIDFAKVFIQRGLIEAFEVEKSAEQLGLAQAAAEHPTIGSGKIHIAVFEDFMCPFCAKFYNETFPALEKMAEEGKVTLHFLDLVVHRQGVSLRLHRLLACYYAKTHDAEGYVEAVKEIYRLLWSGMQRLQKGEINETVLNQEYQSLFKKLEEKLGVTDNCTAAKAPMETTALAAKLGLQGTPSFAAWREGAGYVVLTEGFRTPSFFEKLVESLSSG